MRIEPFVLAIQDAHADARKTLERLIAAVGDRQWLRAAAELGRLEAQAVRAWDLARLAERALEDDARDHPRDPNRP